MGKRDENRKNNFFNTSVASKVKLVTTLLLQLSLAGGAWQSNFSRMEARPGVTIQCCKRVSTVRLWKPIKEIVDYV